MKDAKDRAEKFSRSALMKLGPVAPFLSKSVSTLLKGEPLVVDEDTSVREALSLLQREKKGCVLITGSGEELVGIFTERDCVLKVVSTYCEGTSERPVKDFMTVKPVTVAPDAPVAYALNLMSHGGFRHLPVVADGVILGLVNVKDLVDAVVQSVVDAL